MPYAARTAVIPIARARPTEAGGPCVRTLALDTVCNGCQLSALCPPCGQVGRPTDATQRVVFARQRVLAGQHLYQRGDRFRYLYAVRAGALKSTLAPHHGHDQISGFHLPGEVFALDGVASGVHTTTTTALEDALVCAVAYGPLVDTIGTDALLDSRLSRLMGNEISRGHRQMLLLGTLSAHERLAAFLLDQLHRCSMQGHSAREFNLRMTRTDIGSFLCLTLETISRTFTSFQAQGLLQVDQRHIRIVDLHEFTRRYQSM